MLDVRVTAAVLVRDEILRIGLEVAVRVAHQPEIRRLTDEHAVSEHLQRSRKDQPLGEHGPLVHPAIVVRILEHHDPTERLVLVGGGDRVHVADHFDDPHAALWIEVDRNRVLNHRLAGDELDPVARLKNERLHRVSGRKGGRGSHRLGRGRGAGLRFGTGRHLLNGRAGEEYHDGKSTRFDHVQKASERRQHQGARSASPCASGQMTEIVREVRWAGGPGSAGRGSVVGDPCEGSGIRKSIRISTAGLCLRVPPEPSPHPDHWPRIPADSDHQNRMPNPMRT